VDGGLSPGDRFDRVVAAADGALWIVTLRTVDGERSGCLVGFATQCSIDPVRFLVCLSDKNHTYAVTDGTGHLGVHLVPADRHDLAETFGGLTGDEVDKLAHVAWHEGPAGVPLVAGCPDWFVGRIIERVPLGDHVGFVLAVVDAAPEPPGSPPLRLGAGTDIDAGHDA
jgi:flavin reductase (DIM6/NTAB) family NADH-FMN oxidoreductase RutF